MCLEFDCFECEKPSRWYCKDYNDDVNHCDTITAIDATKKEKCYTCDLIECLKKELKRLVYQEPWRGVGHADKEDWETEATKIYRDSDDEEDQSSADSSAEGSGW